MLLFGCLAPFIFLSCYGGSILLAGFHLCVRARACVCVCLCVCQPGSGMISLYLPPFTHGLAASMRWEMAVASS